MILFLILVAASFERNTNVDIYPRLSYVFICVLGHSLGGALATFAALDVSLHTIPRVNAWLKHQEK